MSIHLNFNFKLVKFVLDPCTDEDWDKRMADQEFMKKVFGQRRFSSEPQLDAWYIKGEQFHDTNVASSMTQLNVNKSKTNHDQTAKLADNNVANKDKAIEPDIESYHSVTSLDFVFDDKMAA